MKRRALALLLTLCMVLGLLPMTALAAEERAETPVFDTAETPAETLTQEIPAEDTAAVPVQEAEELPASNAAEERAALTALPEADAQGVITLTADVTLDATYAVTTGEATLNLNGWTLTGPSNAAAITVSSGATLTIKDEKDATTGNGSSESGRVVGANTNASYCHVENKGTLNISGGTFSAGENAAAEDMIDNAGGTLNVSGGVFGSGTKYTLYNYSNGTVNVSGGAFDCAGTYQTVYNSMGGNTVNVTGGTFTNSTNSYVFNNYAALKFEPAEGKTISVYKETGSAALVCNNAYNYGGTIYKGTLTIAGGTFSNPNGEALHLRCGATTITGGEFKGDETGAAQAATIDVGAAAADQGDHYDAPTVTISGGTITGAGGVAGSGGATITFGAVEGGSGVTINAKGTNHPAVMTYVGENAAYVISGGVFTSESSYALDLTNGDTLTVTGGKFTSGTDAPCLALHAKGDETEGAAVTLTEDSAITGGSFSNKPGTHSEWSQNFVPVGCYMVEADGYYSFYEAAADAVTAAGETGAITVRSAEGFLPLVSNATATVITDANYADYESIFGARPDHDIRLPWLLVKFGCHDAGDLAVSVKNGENALQFGTADEGGAVVKSDALTMTVPEGVSTDDAWVAVHLVSQADTDHKGQDWLDQANPVGSYTVTVSLNGVAETAAVEYKPVTSVAVKDGEDKTALTVVQGTAGSAALTATVNADATEQGVTWAVTAAPEGAAEDAVTVSDAGAVAVAATAAVGEYTVTATSVGYGETGKVTGAYVVTVAEKTYTLTVNAQPAEGGTVTFTVDSSEVTESVAGKSVSFAIEPAEGYVVQMISVANEDREGIAVTDRAFTMPEKNVVVDVVFMTTEEALEALATAVDAAWDATNIPVLDTAEEAPAGEKFATPAVMDAYIVAIQAAEETLGNDEVTAAEVAQALSDLAEATQTFNAALGEGTNTEIVSVKDGLQDALDQAAVAKEGVQTAETADEVTEGTKWVLAEEMEALDAAIQAAQAVMDDPEAAQTAVNEAQTELYNAIEVFEDAKREGTKEATTPATGTTTGSPTVTVVSGGTKSETVTTPDGSVITTATDKDGNKTITVVNKDGETVAEVSLPASSATATKFKDVPEGHWAEASINNMAALGMVKGVNEAQDIFDMESPMTRAAVATMFYRLSGGKAGTDSAFADVAADAWYADAVGWASKAGVVNGYSAEAFGPDDSITRQQLAAMLCRFASLLGQDTETDGVGLAAFTDGDLADDWAVASLSWCVKNGVMQGRGDGTLDPISVVTRAETAAMFDRMIALLKK